MAQSQVGTAWGPYDFDLTRLVSDPGTMESPTDSAQPVEPAPMVAMSRVLSAWRAAERRLGDHIEASPERALIRAELVALCATYHRLFEERRRRPEPAMQQEVYGWRAGITANGRAS